MPEIYPVNNLAEALTLLESFKSEGKYDLFRGQSSNWPLVSYAARLSKEIHAEGVELIKRLHNFFSSNMQLHKYADDVDWFYAVAQHYGVPTNYIDFTNDPKIALYFATNSLSNAIGKECAIICLEKEDFERFISITAPNYNAKTMPFILEIDVDNLWRLQAQSGHFLYIPFPNFEQLYDFDRILFPFTEPYI